MVLFEKLTGDVCKKNNVLQVLEFFLFLISLPLFSSFGLLFFGIFLFWFYLLLLVVVS